MALHRPIDGPRYQEGLDYRKADLHLHSNYSYDVPSLAELSPRSLYDKAVSRGLDFFTLTDHDTMDGVVDLRGELTSEFGANPPIPLIPGVEMKVRDEAVGHTVHINVLGLEPGQFRDLEKLRCSMGAFLSYCRSRGLYHAYNHPFWFERGERGRLSSIEALVQEFPVVELNAGRIRELNDRTVDLARRFEKALVATSDSHTGQVGKSITLAPGTTPDEFLGNVRRGVSRVVPQHAAFWEFMGEVRELIDLFLGGTPAQREWPQGTVGPRFLYRIVGSPWIHRVRPVRTSLRTTLQLAACGPAYFFIRGQRRMCANLRRGR